ncbi:hypothetical protein [Sphingobium sp. Z007]|uniref:hypothetical protein n=1 Tax=Sphingobium sp. Z007 TaxID=627495 RepID=UPI000B497CB3|nr:hypothetical protein [Sphingobium sp. Z007]
MAIADRSMELSKLPRFHPDIEYSDESPMSRLKAELFARDYGAIGDGTLRTVGYWIQNSLPLRINKRSLEALQVDYPHVTSPNDSLDWAAIQKAISTGKNVAIHDGRYMLGDKQLDFPNSGQSLYGLNGNFGGTISESGTDGAIIVFTPPAGNTKQAALRCRGSLQRIVGLKFVSQGTTGDNVAIVAQKNNNNNDDLDIEILNCQFSNCFESIYTYGRGVRIDGCLFSTNNSGFAITTDWPATGNAGDEGQIGDLYKGRGFRINNNRCHGSGTLWRIRNFLVRGGILSNCTCDVGVRLLLAETVTATAGLIYSNINNCVADLVQSSPFSFGLGTKWIDNCINGGSYGGALAGDVAAVDRRPGAIAFFNGCAEIRGVAFNDVNMHNTDSHFVQFLNDAGGPVITITSVSVKGGIMTGFGQTGDDRAILFTAYDIQGFHFDPGSIADPGPAVTALIRSSTANMITDVYIGPAASQLALPTFGGITLGGVINGVTRQADGAIRRYLGATTRFSQINSGSPNGSVIGYRGSDYRDYTSGLTYTFNGTNGTTTGWTSNTALIKANVAQRNQLTANNWLSSSTPADNNWSGTAWSPELGIMVAVSTSGTGNRAMWSLNGIDWTLGTSAADNAWNDVCWSPELGIFVAVASTGTGNRVMTSANGKTWTIGASAADNSWQSVCWSPELRLFAAVSTTGASQRVMTSPDALVWTARNTPAANSWVDVCWAQKLGMFVAVSTSGTGNRVMTSLNGLTWVSQTSAFDNDWRSIAYSHELGLVVAVASTGTGNRVMTSANGATWTIRSSAADNDWYAVSWAPEIGLFAAVAQTGTGTRVMTSIDGEAWVTRTSAADNGWRGICWANQLGLFSAVANSGTGNRAMTSKSAFSLSYR